LRSGPASGRGRRGFHGFRGLFWLLGLLGFSTASAAATGTDTAAAAALLEARVKAARQVLGDLPGHEPPVASPLAQWLNDPDWRNWGNWPNWFNQ
jgi:hypothetical protein